MVFRTALYGPKKEATPMKIHKVHSRELPVAPDEVGALLDALGTPGDRLWPTDRWPTTPLELDGPLAVGTQSRQGILPLTQIRQVVDDYRRGRRIAFRFAPGLGIVGTHRLDVEPLGRHRCRLTHTLEGRVEPKLIPVYPILIGQHDALVEDLLDRAELATTGRIARPARWPTSVRIANALELAIARRRGILPAPPRATLDRLTGFSGIAVPVVLVALAALHASWALGSYWPGDSESELAEYVLSRGERDRLDGGLPPVALTWTVALGLAGAAAIVRNAATGARSRALRGAAWGVAGVFFARAVAYLPSDLIGGLNDQYQRLDLALYAPLCLALAAGTTIVLRRGMPRPSRRPRPTRHRRFRARGRVGTADTGGYQTDKTLAEAA
jgi:hypothetical protein